MSKDISFIIPLYNKNVVEFRNCLESICLDDMDYEIIIINDGSKKELTLLYQDIITKNKNKKKIRYFFQKNQGVSAARNKGIEVAKGNYVFFVDADDMLIPNSIKRMDLLKKPCPDLLIYDVRKIENGKVSQMKLKNHGHLTKSILYETLLSDGLMNWVTAKLCSTTFLRKFNLKFDTTLKSSEDIDFNFNCLKSLNNCRYVDKVVYNYNFSFKTEYNRVKTSPLRILNDIHNAYILRINIVKILGLSDEFKSKLNNIIIDEIFDIYSTYLLKNYAEAKENSSKFTVYLTELKKCKTLNKNSKIKLFLLQKKCNYFIKCYGFFREKYLLIRGKI